MDTKLLDFSGHYYSEKDNKSTTLTILQKGAAIEGELKRDSDRYILVGVVINDMARGRISNIETSQNYVFEAQINNDILLLNMMTKDLNSGITITDTYSFNIENKKPVEYDTFNDTVAKSNKAIIIDNSMIGTWARDELIASTSMPLHTKFLIELDVGANYKIAGATKLDGKKDTGYSGDTTTGKWKTSGNILYIMVSGSQYWKPYARYEILNDKMTFILEDGERQVWKRIEG